MYSVLSDETDGYISDVSDISVNINRTSIKQLEVMTSPSQEKKLPIRKKLPQNNENVYLNVPQNKIASTFKEIVRFEISLAQLSDPECVRKMEEIRTHKCMNNHFAMDMNGVLYKKIFNSGSHWNYRVYVPELHGRTIILTYLSDTKGTRHPPNRSIWDIKKLFTWPSMFSDIKSYLQNAEVLSFGRVTRSDKSSVKQQSYIDGATIPVNVVGNKEKKRRGNYNVKNKELRNKATMEKQDRVDNFYNALISTKQTNKTQVVIDISNMYENKPIINVEIFGRRIKALIDSGAEVSVVDSSCIRGYDPTQGYVKTSLVSPVAGNAVDGYHTNVDLILGGEKILQSVCVAPMEDIGSFQMLIGYNMIQQHGGVFDTINNKIRFALDNTQQCLNRIDKVNCSYIAVNNKEVELKKLIKMIKIDDIDLSIKQRAEFKSLIHKYQDILIEDVALMTGANLPPYAPVFKTDTPVYTRQYRIPHSLFGPLRKKLDKFEEAGIVRRAHSQWNSPILAVRKPDGVDVRMVLDLRQINQVIEPVPYPLVRIEDIINRLGGSKVFSNLDLNNGYYNVKLAEHIKEHFAFTTPWGRYVMERLPQGCITSASIFQQIMNTALHDLIGEGNIFVFQDDVIVHSATVEEHIIVLDKLFRALKEINMAVRPTKCTFFKEKIKFLGHIVGAAGSKPSEENINAIRFFERPRTVKQVRSFLGTVNFYRKFIKDITTVAAPLYALIKKDKTKVEWDEDCDRAFLALKKALVEAPVLAYPDFSRPFVIKSDASNIGIGGVLEQEIDGETHPIAYCSRKLNRAEQNYSVIEREALAIVYVLSQFRHLIYGFEVVLKTDHKPLSYLFQLKESNQRLVRWLLHVQDYNLKIEHIPGHCNIVADMLSRSDENSEILNVGVLREKFELLTNIRIREAQHKDIFCKEIIDQVKNNEFINNEYILDEQEVLLKQVCPARYHGWQYRVIVPKSLTREIMFNYHDRVYSGHLSLPKVMWKVKQVFTWDSMFRDISEYVKTCELCQRRNTGRTRAPFQAVTPPSYPMERLNVDILGPFQMTRSKKRYLILYTDSLSRMVFGSALPNIEAATVAKDYMENVFSLHGGSRQILTDRGGQFTGKIFQEMCKRLGIKHVTTSGYRPCANGIAERANQRVLRILAHLCNKHYNDWDQKLPYVLHAIRTSVHRSTGESPFFIFHCFDPIDPVIESSHTYRETHDSASEYIERTLSEIESIRAEVVENLTISSKKNCEAKNKGSKLREFNIGQQVLFLDSASYSGKNRKLQPRFKGTYRIIARLGLVNYRIRNVQDSNDVRTAHVDKLKLYFPRVYLDDVNENLPESNHYEAQDSRSTYDVNISNDGEDLDEFRFVERETGNAITANQNVVNTSGHVIDDNIDLIELDDDVISIPNNMVDIIDISISPSPISDPAPLINTPSNMNSPSGQSPFRTPIIPFPDPETPTPSPALSPIPIAPIPIPILMEENTPQEQDDPESSESNSDIGEANNGRFNDRYFLRSNPKQTTFKDYVM